MGDDLSMLKHGQMMILRDHQMVALQEEMLLIDSTRIAPDWRLVVNRE